MTSLPALLFVSLLVRLCYCIPAATTDTITVNQTLKDGDLLLSSAKSYALGFFTPGNSTGKRYVGIWYRKIPERLVVWVANRNSPVNGTSGILSVDVTGNLVIQDRKTNTSVWNTSLSFPENRNTQFHSALLQETGNLVLYTASKILWQSFDCPTNTLIANMKFGVDRKRGLNLSLTSWKSADDPGMGRYSMSIETKGKPQAYLFKDSARVWRLGPWNGIRWSGVPEMTPNITPYIFTENGDEVTEEYWIKDPNIYTIVMLNETGTLNKILWQGEEGGDKKWVGNWYYPNNDDCDSYDRCGAFGICNPYNQPGGFDCRCVSSGFKPESVTEWSRRDGKSGCRRSPPLQCGNGDGFLKLGNMKIPDTETAEVNRGIKRLEECEELCMKNCSCTGYAGNNVSDGGAAIGCITWYGELRDMREFTKGGQDMYIRVSASDLLGHYSKEPKGQSRKWIAAVVVAVLFVAALILVAICLALKWRKTGKKQQIINNENIHSIERGSSPTMGKYMEGAAATPPADVLIFDLNTIQAATHNFSLENKLGEGGFGCVYKGKMGNGQLVAVKRLTRSSDQGIEEFKNEVILIARLQHRNLVRLLGYCIQEGEKMLVYEYLPNKGLDSFLFENTLGTHLHWRMRFEIILGVAQGLLYLHQDSRLRIIHRDLKASNVLLDASMEPKISDFGMARIFGEEQVEDNTNRVVGTYGYMSPEYAMEGHFSAKSDVFSFGVLLLEIVSGKKNKHKFNEHSLNLVGDAWDFWNEDKAVDVVDPSLKDEPYDVGEVLRCIHVGLLCVQPYPDDRPNMSEVVFMLNNETQLPPPNPPGFVFELPKTDQFWSTSTSAGNQHSINCVSITAIKGR